VTLIEVIILQKDKSLKRKKTVSLLVTSIYCESSA